MENPARINVILRPRLFGKSLALSMLRTYFDYRVKPGPGFKLLSINDEARDDFYLKHGQQYAVITLDWRAGRVLRATSMKDLQARIRGYLQSVFLDQINMFGLGLKDVKSWAERSALKRDFKFSIFFDDQPLAASVKLLSALITFVSSVSERSVIVLVDDYDEVLAKAGELAANGEEYREIEGFFEDFYYQAFGKGSAFKVCIFGVHRLSNFAPFSRLLQSNSKMVSFHDFSDETEPFAEDFGFTSEEVTEAMEKVKVKDIDLYDLNLHYQLDWGGKRDILHPYSIAAALKYGSLDEYWVRRTPLNFFGYPFARAEDWGVGDMSRLCKYMSRTNLESVIMLAVSYDPSKRVGAGHVLQHMVEEGFLRTKLGHNLTREISSYLDYAWIHWFDHLTGIVEAIRSIESGETDPLKLALQRVVGMQNFYKGLPAMDPSCTNILNELFQTILSYLFDFDKAYYGDYKLVEGDDGSTRLFVHVPGIVKMNYPEYVEFSRKQIEGVRGSKFNSGRASITIVSAVIFQADGSSHVLSTKI